MLVYTKRDPHRRGTPLFHISKIVGKYGVRMLKMPDSLPRCSEKQYVYLSCDRLDSKLRDSSCKRYVLYIGGFDIKYNGRPNQCKSELADMVVFNSQFYSQIARSSHLKINKHQVIYMIAPLPVDDAIDDLVTEREPIQDKINFVAIAKWWKRPFKRQSLIIKLFNDYIQKKYPNSELHLLGCSKDNDRKGDVIYHKAGFHNPAYIDIFKNAHVQLMISPLDAAPKTLTESLFYRVPFVCSNNCVGPELIDKLGECGKAVNIDPPITTVKDCTKYCPFTNKKFYNNKRIDFQGLMNAVEEVVENFQAYTSWQWKDDLNPVSEAKKWVALLSL